MNHHLTGPGMSLNAPNQYAVDGRCVECMRPLSRYNPYVVCGPCRVRLASGVADAVTVAENDDDAKIIFAWERFPRREPVRRGPLLAETWDMRDGHIVARR